MRTVVITGATSGIGFSIAQQFAEQFYCVIGVGRSREKCAAAVDKIKALVPGGKVIYFCGDLMHQREVHAIADQIAAYLVRECQGKLEILISNAGGVRSWYSTTEDGYEQQFALNHLAGFLLTYRLTPFLANAGGRVILTGSNSHKNTRIRWRDIMMRRRYSCLFAYKQSKLCNVFFAKEFNRRFSALGIRAYVVDPGLVNTEIGCKHTGGIVNLFWGIRKRFGVSPDVAARTYSFLANQEPAPPGLYYYQCHERRYNRRADRVEDTRRLFDLSERLCGIKYNEGVAACSS